MRKEAIVAILVMLTVWCTWNSAKISKHVNGDTVFEDMQRLNTRSIASLVDRLDAYDRADEEEEVPEPIE